jgi:colanic acid/amylovoran biosynthesis glycosyltransferase
MNVAIISPTQSAYSETFILAHKKIDAKVFYYYGGVVPNYLEGYGSINPKRKFLIRLIRKFSRKISGETFSIAEMRLIKSLQRNKIDIVFAEYGTTGAELVPVCKKIKLPLVTIFHGYDASIKDVIENYRVKYVDLFHFARKILAVSTTMQEKLVSLGCPENKIIRTTYGPDNRFLEINPTFNEPESFVAIGRFVNKKAPYYTVLAIKKVAEKHPNVKLYFAGDGELFNTAQNLIKYFRLENNIKLLGPISPDEYSAILAKVTGFIQHSITAANGDMEGTPVAVLEASAAGIPIIATRHAGISDVIIDGATGLLVDEHDVDGMANQIIQLIENPELAKRMGQMGKENIKINFSMEKHLGLIKSALLGVYSDTFI